MAPIMEKSPVFEQRAARPSSYFPARLLRAFYSQTFSGSGVKENLDVLSRFHPPGQIARHVFKKIVGRELRATLWRRHRKGTSWLAPRNCRFQRR